jgi:DAK2 domain fusion protein YloV
MFRDGIISGSNNISNSRQAVDALNIFPVPDGDTGTNMSMTIGAAAKEMAVLPDDCSLSEASSRCASALLRGARGNSGVILSLIFRGFAKSFKGIESAGAKDLANAFSNAVDAAYKAVMNPTEGTILTVIRKASEAANDMAETMDDPLEVGFAALMAAREALAKTPEQLPVLKKAGVVDAGGQGLILILEGFLSVFEREVIIQPIEGAGTVNPVSKPDKSTVANASGDIEFAYCSEFLIEKDTKAKTKDPLKLRAYLESIGDCVVVVDDNDIIKVHVHSNEPGNVIQSALKYGQLINIKIDNMRYQHRNAEVGVAEGEPPVLPEAEPVNAYGFVAVSAGDGLADLFKDLGADVVVSGGQTMNPSTDDILNAIMATPAKTVFVLPNNKNIIMAAEQAISLAEGREVRVLQTKTIPQGISAMLMFDESEDADANQMAMMEAAESVSTSQVTFAARDSEVDGRPVKQGEIMGLCNGKIKFIGEDIADIAYKSADKIIKRNQTALVTIIFGEGATEEMAEEIQQKLADKYGDDIEFTIVNGGQPIYYFIISAE